MSAESRKALTEELEAAKEERRKVVEVTKNQASVYETLSQVDFTGKTETKPSDVGPDLTYVSWPYALGEAIKRYPTLAYEVVKNQDGLPYFESPAGYIVYTRITIEGVTREMWLPVMDGRNRSMGAEPYEVQTRRGKVMVAAATMTDINKAVMWCLVKNLAAFGLGLYVYAGEDLPETLESPVKAETPDSTTPAAPAPEKPVAPTKEAPTPAPGWKMTEEHKEAYMEALQEVQEPYNRIMEEPLYKALLREMGVKTFKEIEDERFPLLMEKIEACRVLVCGGEA